TPEEIALARAREELAQFRYLGYLNKGGQESAFLSKGKDLFIVTVGEEVQGRFVLRELSSGFAVIHDKGSGAEVTLTLSR
ncbi:MAG TPA: hypothetical protein VFG95_03300, partial [Nitrospiria bacterium]|nr:hypothetical protein [Nitrospiria bacterium]